MDCELTRRRPPAYFHGGVDGLPVGTCIVPGGLVETDDELWYSTSDPEFYFVATDLLQA